MSRRHLILPVLGALALVPSGAAIGTAATKKKKPAKPVTKVVHVVDNVYTFTGGKKSGTASAALKVKPNTTIKWVWGENQNTHDVNLKKPYPKGVKKFHSALAASEFVFKKTLTKPGTYRIYCSIHTTMRMIITVKK
jgi:plastocyanin